MVVWYLMAISTGPTNAADDDIINETEEFLQRANENYERTMSKVLKASWHYETTQNRSWIKKKNFKLEVYEGTMKDLQEEIKSSYTPPIDQNNENNAEWQIRQFTQIERLAKAIIPIELRIAIEELITIMNSLYMETTILSMDDHEFGEYDEYDDVPNNGASGSFTIKDIKLILQTTENFEERRFIALQFQYDIQKKLLPFTQKYYDYMAALATYHDFNTISQYVMMVEGLSDFDIVGNVDKLLGDFFPFYNQLFKYFRKRLYEKYKSGAVTNNKQVLLPSFIATIYPSNPLFKPYPTTEDEISESVKKSSIMPTRLMDEAKIFYATMGLPYLANELTKNSLRLHHATSDHKNMSAWNFFNDDYRLLWTATDDELEMRNVYRGVGHLQNFQAFSHLPVILQGWPTNAVKEAIVEAATISAFSPTYLERTGILEDSEIVTREVIINRQLSELISLFKTTSVSLLMPDWGGRMYTGQVPNEDYNNYWWRLEYQSVGDTRRAEGLPPIIDGTLSLEQFIIQVLKFQFFQKLCTVAGEFYPDAPTTKPLHLCNISGNKEAGKLLYDVMRQGNSISFEETLKLMTDKRRLEINPLLNYYRPFFSDFLGIEYAEESSSSSETSTETLRKRSSKMVLFSSCCNA